MKAIRSSKSKSHSGHKHHKRDRDQKIKALEEQIEQKNRIIDKKEEIIKEYSKLVAESKALGQLVNKYKKELKETSEEFQGRLDLRDQEIGQKERKIRGLQGSKRGLEDRNEKLLEELERRDQEIRRKAKEIQGLRDDNKSLSVDQEEKRRLKGEVSALKKREEGLLDDNRKLELALLKSEEDKERQREILIKRLEKKDKALQEAERLASRLRPSYRYLGDPPSSARVPLHTY